MSEDKLKGVAANSVKSAKSRFREVEPERLVRFIEAQDNVSGNVTLADIQYLSDGAGSSNGIALFNATFELDGQAQTRSLVLRYNPGVKLFRQIECTDEFKTMDVAHRHGVALPKAHWLDEQGHWLGVPGYIMDKAEGTPPRQNFFSSGALAEVSTETRREMMLSGADFLATLHSAGIGESEVPHLRHRGHGSSAIERELNWWVEEVRLAREPDDPGRIFLDSAHRKLVERIPRTDRIVLQHGDSNFGNFVFLGDEISAVLDWELSSLGLGECDLAYMTLTNEDFKRLDTQVEGVPTTEDYIRRYESNLGRPVEHWSFCEAYAYFRISCVGALAAVLMPPEFARAIFEHQRTTLSEKFRQLGVSI